MVRVFANGLGDWGSISGWDILKTQKMVCDASLLNTQHYYKVLNKCKWSHPGKGVVFFPNPWCSSYWKGSLWVALNHSRPTYYIYEHCMVAILFLYNKLLFLIFPFYTSGNFLFYQICFFFILLPSLLNDQHIPSFSNVLPTAEFSQLVDTLIWLFRIEKQLEYE